jgi:hypothetical protein
MACVGLDIDVEFRVSAGPDIDVTTSTMASAGPDTDVDHGERRSGHHRR